MSGHFQPAIVKFSKNSYIIIEGKTGADRFYIIQEGKIRITREIDILVEPEGSIAGPGEIFGVVSTLAARSYIETAMALTDVTLLAIERKQYDDLIRGNTPIAVKIIQQFSQRLRTLDEVISLRAINSAGKNDPSHLYEVAEFYAANKRFNHAFYAYSAYRKYCPGGEYADAVQKQMAAIAPRVKVKTPVYPPEKMNRTYPADCLLFAEGEPGHELYVIQQGSVKVTKITGGQEVVLAVLNKGEMVGEMALLEDMPRAATVETSEGCTVLAVNRANFEGMIADQPELVARLTILLAERIWVIYRQLSNTLIDNPLGRLYDVLLVQLEKDRVDTNTNQSHTCQFGFQELAGMAGLSPKESEGLLSKLLLGKRISVNNGKIFVSDASDVLRQAQYYRQTQKRTENRDEV